jgi:hypothetical protein
VKESLPDDFLADVVSMSCAKSANETKACVRVRDAPCVPIAVMNDGHYLSWIELTKSEWRPNAWN